MTEGEFVKIGAEAALKPFSNLMERLFGGAADEIGGMWADHFKARRIERQCKIMRRLQEKIEKDGFDPNPIPDKIWMPALSRDIGSFVCLRTFIFHHRPTLMG